MLDPCLLQKERPLIVGVSGGADSFCLMNILREAGYKIIVAHFDHQLRSESNQDAQVVKETCTRLALECIVESQNVRAYADEQKLSIEEAARELRYRFMFDLAKQKNAQAVAVGHTADDQVETILMHILRGSSLNGLKGMSHRAIIKNFDEKIPIVRPLLEMKREETVAYCAAHNLHPLYDISNDSLEYQRNKIRHQLIPTLETYNPKFREALLRMSQTLKDDSELLDSLVDAAWRECAAPQSGFVTLDIFLLAKYAASLQRHIIKRAMLTLIPNIDVDFAALNRAVENLHKRTDLKSGLYMFHEGKYVYICTKDAELPLNLFPQMKDESIQVSIPSTVELANGWALTLAYAENFQVEEIAANENPLEVWFDAAQVGESLHLRKYQRGDKFIPLGMDGHSQKLSDLFVNEKIPQRARENWVLLCSKDEIIWVAGIRSSHKYRVTDSTKKIIRVNLSSPDRESTFEI